MDIVISQQTTVSVVVSMPASQSGHSWFKSGYEHLTIGFVDFIFLFYLICIRVCIFVTRVAKHSSQPFNINTRNNHKGIFSCNRWWCVGM